MLTPSERDRMLSRARYDLIDARAACAKAKLPGTAEAARQRLAEAERRLAQLLAMHGDDMDTLPGRR